VAQTAQAYWWSDGTPVLMHSMVNALLLTLPLYLLSGYRTGNGNALPPPPSVDFDSVAVLRSFDLLCLPSLPGGVLQCRPRLSGLSFNKEVSDLSPCLPFNLLSAELSSVEWSISAFLFLFNFSSVGLSSTSPHILSGFVGSLS
jgi:hypothetical protein